MLVLQLGLNPQYVLDQMQMYEVRSLLQYSYYRDKESWEQSRLIAYITAQTQSTKRIKPTDIMTFPWEKDNANDLQDANKRTNKQPTNEDVKRLQNIAKQFEQNLFNKESVHKFTQ
jgi:hypothetical protein